MTTHKLETTKADIVYDVHGPLPTGDGHPPLFMIGQPMDASGFSTLASHFPDRTEFTFVPYAHGRAPPPYPQGGPGGPRALRRGRRRARPHRGCWCPRGAISCR